MNRDEVVSYGIKDPEGQLLWSFLRTRNPSHNDILSEMRREQKLLATYSKYAKKRDANQDLMLRRIRLLETFAWRIYMFGSEPTLTHPGRTGELRKRQRTDPEYWKMLEKCNVQCGTTGCEQIVNLYRSSRRPCARKDCTHQGQKKADKWLKFNMRQEWERSVLKRYMY